MMRLIFTVYMLLLFIFSATAKDKVTIHKTVDQCVVVVKSTNHAIAHKKAHSRHKRMHRRNARLEKKIRRSHRRHVVAHH
ncbi:MAG: hypothetical protein RLO17_17310 [Cyclobacteriaceae bacterium]